MAKDSTALSIGDDDDVQVFGAGSMLRYFESDAEYKDDQGRITTLLGYGDRNDSPAQRLSQGLRALADGRIEALTEARGSDLSKVKYHPSFSPTDPHLGTLTVTFEVDDSVYVETIPVQYQYCPQCLHRGRGIP